MKIEHLDIRTYLLSLHLCVDRLTPPPHRPVCMWYMAGLIDDPARVEILRVWYWCLKNVAQ